MTREGRYQIAVSVFQNRVCPRFDLSREILIYDPQTFQQGPVERIDVSGFLPETMVAVLAKKQVRVVIAGGIQDRYRAMFLNDQIEVVYGVTGEVTNVIQAFMRKALHPRASVDFVRGTPKVAT